jgi:hypothetical protein
MKAESFSLLIRRGSFALPGIDEVEKAYLGSLHHDPATGKLRFGGEGAAPRGYSTSTGKIHEEGKAPRFASEEERNKMFPEASPSVARQGAVPGSSSSTDPSKISPPVQHGGTSSPYDVITSAPASPQAHQREGSLPSGHTFTMESMAHPQVRSSGAKPPSATTPGMSVSQLGGAKPPPLPKDIGMAQTVRAPEQLKVAAKAIEGQQEFMAPVHGHDPMYSPTPTIHHEAAKHVVMQMHHEQNGNYDAAKVHQNAAQKLMNEGADPQLEHFRAAAQATEGERKFGAGPMRQASFSRVQKGEDNKDKDKEILSGGLGDKRLDSDFSTKQLMEGMKVESEHTPDKKIQKEIAKDHLSEDKDYYKKLKLIEKSLDSINDLLKSSIGSSTTSPSYSPKLSQTSGTVPKPPTSSGTTTSKPSEEFKPEKPVEAPKPEKPVEAPKPEESKSPKPAKEPKAQEAPGRGSAYSEGMGYGGLAGSDVGSPAGGMAPVRALAGLGAAKLDLASWQAARQGQQQKGPQQRGPFFSRSIDSKLDLRKSAIKLYIGI